MTLGEIDGLEKVPEINRAIAARALTASSGLLRQATIDSPTPGPYEFYLG